VGASTITHVSRQTPTLPFRSGKPTGGGRDDGRGRFRREPDKPELKSGRAWINGAEVGGTDPRYAHLNRSYD
jgi:hypothetical protein